MANAVRVRVELRNYNQNASFEERWRDFKSMNIAFKKACSAEGVAHAYRQHESFESESRKKRRKKRESELARLKQKLKENFPQQGKKEKGKKGQKEYE